MGNCTKWSKTRLLKLWQLDDHISTLKRSQVYRCWLFSSIRAVKEYNKAKCINFWESNEIMWVPVAANRHEGNALIEQDSRRLRDSFKCLLLARPQITSMDLVSAATFNKNTCWRYQNILEFGLLYNRVQNLLKVCNLPVCVTMKNSQVKTSHRQLQSFLKAAPRDRLIFHVGQSVHIWRNNTRRIGTEITTELNDHSVQISLRI